jgi:hypothetical protein
VPPQTIAAQNSSGGVVTRTRPLCPYPQTAIYNGSGSIDDAANFQCGGNLKVDQPFCGNKKLVQKEPQSHTTKAGNFARFIRTRMHFASAAT